MVSLLKNLDYIRSIPVSYTHLDVYKRQASDAGKFELAQQYLERMNSNIYINDYTRTSKILNPGHDSRYFSLARLALWRGNSKLAQQLMDDRLFNKTPGDPWVRLQKAELERNRGNYDDEMCIRDRSWALWYRNGRVSTFH